MEPSIETREETPSSDTQGPEDGINPPFQRGTSTHQGMSDKLPLHRTEHWARLFSVFSKAMKSHFPSVGDLLLQSWESREDSRVLIHSEEPTYC